MGFYPTRESLQKLIGLETADRHPSKLEHILITLITFATILYFGITVHSLGKVYALVGGFCATTLAYIIPGAAYLLAGRQQSFSMMHKRLTEDDSDTLLIPNNIITGTTTTATETTVTKLYGQDHSVVMDIAAGLLVIWGIFVMVVSTSGVFTNPSSSDL